MTNKSDNKWQKVCAVATFVTCCHFPKSDNMLARRWWCATAIPSSNDRSKPRQSTKQEKFHICSSLSHWTRWTNIISSCMTLLHASRQKQSDFIKCRHHYDCACCRFHFNGLCLVLQASAFYWLLFWSDDGHESVHTMLFTCSKANWLKAIIFIPHLQF